ncbi:leucyl aminopeptidase [Persicimonas caeni]|uniref:Probable cytosol aminopeptidase n=1 Tax=Persicimonas caeni TaxID=2292766 RepID=A0A4Y6PWH3_PERCE|nr:leucyl aminopeptidase [Persicimonas caeni]QDG52489.1 leucyl aminopeptidase [Persicimonas caeni]QED33711.1 leucyl aminopeptidase [Persicimonas caeni]
MDYRTSDKGTTEIEADLLVVPVSVEGLEERRCHALRMISEKSRLDLFVECEREEFEAKPGQTIVFRRLNELGAERVLLVGLGGEDERAGDALWRGGVRAGRRAFELRAKHVALALPDGQNDGKGAARAASEVALGVSYGIYRFDKYLRREDQDYEGPDTLTLVRNGRDVDVSLDEVGLIAHGVALARDMVNEPPGTLTPEEFADRARAIAGRAGLECASLDSAELVQRGFNLIEAVGKGSDNPPSLIHLIYRPDGEVRRKVALVGKGITFDTGGYSMKRPEGMKFMHSDMAGGAAVLGAARVLGELKPEGIEIHFLVPAAENAVNGRATRPADIVRGYGGKTVQILNTDAEGRLVLADALAYAQEYDVDTIVDLATLTGSSVVALGGYHAALFSDNDELVAGLTDASKRGCEGLWRMPLPPDIDKQLDSPVADMKNIGSRWGGAISAALFLKRWVDVDRWAHIDMAGPAYSVEGDDLRIVGGTGFGVTTLVEFVRSL